MSLSSHTDALLAIAAAVEEDHEGLTAFTNKLNAIEDVPTFWWKDHPIWMRHHANETLAAWPFRRLNDDQILVPRSDGRAEYIIGELALVDHFDQHLFPRLSAAEVRLFVDLASGHSIDESADAAGVAASTRRKQLQSCFRKLGVSGQVELVSLSSQLTARLLEEFNAIEGNRPNDWSSYLPFLPKGARCGTIEGPHAEPVRYVELGPLNGRPVLVLHSMIFPHLSESDAALAEELGLRLIWPLRPGCLSTSGHSAKLWSDHCAAVVKDLQTLHAMKLGAPVPIVALVSSASYATAFARQAPEAVSQIDFVSTCFSAGKRLTKDAYFGDFLVRKFHQNARMATVAVQHLAHAAFSKNRFERTLRKVFRGSPSDQFLLGEEFGDPTRAERLKYVVRHSINSMRLDYLAQLHFDWAAARALSVPMTFWHGLEDTVHCPGDLGKLARDVSGKDAILMPRMGHLTQGGPFQQVLSRIAKTYSD